MRPGYRSLALLAAPALLLLAGTAGAQPAPADHDALSTELSDAISVGFDGELEQARTRLLAVGAAADQRVAELGDTDPDGARFAALAGSAYFYTAQNHDPERDDAAGQAREVEWLTAALERLERARAALGEQFEASYEYRGVAGQLWQHGHRLDDPRWKEWSAARVAANRLRLAEQPGDTFETNMVAEALFDHGWLTGDTALLAEADTLAASLPEDDLDYGVRSKRDAVARGDAPYSPPGR